MHVYASVTAGSVNPAAIYVFYTFVQPHQQCCAYAISPQKYRNHIHKIILPLQLYMHVYASVTAHAQSTSTTHFSCSSKCRRTSLYKTYHRVFDFSNQKARVRALTFAPPYITLIQHTPPQTPLCS